MAGAFDLPAPSPAAAAHSARLVARVREDIVASGGAIGFDRFMELALYAPGLGYYAAGAAKFGAEGDFVTAPEMTPLFGRTLARFAAPLLRALGTGEVLEVGAGSGALAAALLPELGALGCTPVRYRVLEPSPDLRLRQRARLAPVAAAAGVELAFEQDFPSPGFRGVVIANEVLDAIPVRRFRIGDGGVVEEQQVLVDGHGLALGFGVPADDALAEEVERVQTRVGRALPQGYVSEVAPARRAWLATLATRLRSGLVLIVDYGYTGAEYYHPQRVDGTLACHYRHLRHESPLTWPGLGDITAHVDFSQLAETARAGGLELAGFTTQAQFLLGNGLLNLCAELRPGTPEYLRAAGVVQRLTLPQEMGEAVRVMALSRELAGPPPAGLDGADLRSRL